MKNFIIKIFPLVLAAIFFSSPVLAALRDITGTYYCEEITGKEHLKVVLKITKTDNTYQFEWKGNHGYFIGTGILSDDQSKIAIAYMNPKNPKHVGVELYQISPDGSLKGYMSLLGKKLEWTEECRKKPLALKQE